MLQFCFGGQAIDTVGEWDWTLANGSAVARRGRHGAASAVTGNGRAIGIDRKHAGKLIEWARCTHIAGDVLVRLNSLGTRWRSNTLVKQAMNGDKHGGVARRRSTNDRNASPNRRHRPTHVARHVLVQSIAQHELMRHGQSMGLHGVVLAKVERAEVIVVKVRHLPGRRA